MSDLTFDGTPVAIVARPLDTVNVVVPNAAAPTVNLLILRGPTGPSGEASIPSLINCGGAASSNGA